MTFFYWWPFPALMNHNFCSDFHLEREREIDREFSLFFAVFLTIIIKLLNSNSLSTFMNGELRKKIEFSLWQIPISHGKTKCKLLINVWKCLFSFLFCFFFQNKSPGHLVHLTSSLVPAFVCFWVWFWFSRNVVSAASILSPVVRS